MKYDFDKTIERRGTGSGKWETYDKDVIPLWVADMDFAIAKEVQDALDNVAALDNTTTLTIAHRLSTIQNSTFTQILNCSFSATLITQ